MNLLIPSQPHLPLIIPSITSIIIAPLHLYFPHHLFVTTTSTTTTTFATTIIPLTQQGSPIVIVVGFQ